MRCTIIPEDIPQKISESIFRYKGVPYYVKNAGAGYISLYLLTDLNGSVFKKIKFDDPDFDFSSIPLGYVNYEEYKHTPYLSRTPVRKVKQGVNGQNVKMYFIPGGELNKKYGFNSASVLYSQGFINMTQDMYPSLEEAMIKLRKKKEKIAEIAISRNIALLIDEQDIIKVFYKNQYVGWIQPNKYLVHVKSNDLGWVVSKYLSHILGWQID